MITEEILQQNPLLKTLPEEQRKEIIRVSEVDENTTIARNRGEWWRKLDEDVKSVTGNEKTEGIKSYENLKTVLTDLNTRASKAATLETEISTLKTEKADLLKKISDGSNDQGLKDELATVRKSLSDKESEIAALKDTHNKAMSDLSEKYKSTSSRTMRIEADSEISSGLVRNKVKFVDNVPKDILEETLKNRRSSFVSSLNLGYQDGANGNKNLVMRDEKGEIIRDEKTGLPVSPYDLYFDKIKDLVDTGKTQGGAGGGGAGGGGQSTAISLSGAKTQVEADDLIIKHLVEVEGLAKGRGDFAARQIELRKELKVSELPLR